MTIQRRLSALLLAVLAALTGCRGADTEPAKLVYGLTLAPSGIDPHIHASSELGIALSSVYDTLLFLHPDSGEFVPGLASEWGVSADGLSYTFYLRKDVRFHDGTRFDAETVRFNLDRVMDPDTASQKARYMLGDLARVVVVDDYTVRLELTAPYAPLLDSLSQVYLGMASPTAIERWGNADYQFHQVGTGPFKFVEYHPGDHLTLVRNPEYRWGPEYLTDGVAGPAEIEFRFYQDASTRAIALESGQAQIMGEIPPQDALRLDAAEDYDLVPVSIPGQPLQLFLNSARPPTDELAVRQALIMSIDRVTVVETVFGPWSPVATGPLTRPTLGYAADLRALDYDPDQAGAILDQAGWRDADGDGVRERGGSPLVIELYTMAWGLLPEVAQMLEDGWRQLGIEVHAQQVAYPTALEVGRNGEHNVIPFNLSGTDPAMLESFYASWGSFNWSKVVDEELDALFRQAAVEVDREARLFLYHEAQQRIMDQALVLPLRDYVNLNAVASKVQNLRFDARGWFPLLTEIQLER